MINKWTKYVDSFFLLLINLDHNILNNNVYNYIQKVAQSFGADEGDVKLIYNSLMHITTTKSKDKDLPKSSLYRNLKLTG